MLERYGFDFKMIHYRKPNCFTRCPGMDLMKLPLSALQIAYDEALDWELSEGRTDNAVEPVADGRRR